MKSKTIITLIKNILTGKDHFTIQSFEEADSSTIFDIKDNKSIAIPTDLEYLSKEI